MEIEMEMEMEMESQHVDPESIRSRIGDLTSSFLSIFGDVSVVSPSKLLQDCVSDLETKVNQIVSDHSDVGAFKDEHLDAYMDRLRIEHGMAEAESSSICKEMESLTKSYVEGVCQLESNLEVLRHAVNTVELKGLGQTKAGEHFDNFEHGGHKKSSMEHVDDCFQILNLKHQIEMKKMTLKSLQNLDVDLKRLEAIEKIEETLMGLKVIGFEGNCIRVSLRTYIPNVEGLMCQLKAENYIKVSEVNHELLLEVMEGTMELKHVEIFPNDVYIGEIVEAANTFSKLFSVLSVPETRSSLGWFLQKVQDRIVTCTIRQLAVKTADKSRHSFEYVDKDELIRAHMIGGIDAFIKPSQGWPLSTCALQLVSLRRSEQNANDISLSLLCKVQEVANNLDFNIRKSITNFVDGIEEILLESMRPEVNPNNNNILQ